MNAYLYGMYVPMGWLLIKLVMDQIEFGCKPIGHVKSSLVNFVVVTLGAYDYDNFPRRLTVRPMCKVVAMLCDQL